MAYQSLYRKYRPQTFADVVGQGHVTRTLQNALASGRVAHGYLFTGTRGTAKTTVARLLAKALCCQSYSGPTPEPCNACDACARITAGSCIDVIEMDAASHRGVADIEEVRKSVGYGPMEMRYKVFIIDEAHQLSSDAKDAFLKTLEEPPDNVVFVLATTEPQAIPITIRSRCQQFDFKRGSLAEIASRLRYVLDCEGVTYAPEAVNLVARGAEGSYRDSLSLLEQVLAFSPQHISAADVDTVLGTLDAEALAQVTQAVARKDAPTALALAGQLLDSGKEARTLLKTLAGHFRDLLLVTVGGPAAGQELTPEEVQRLQQEQQVCRFPAATLLRAMDVLNEAQGETRWNNQHRLLVELTFLKLMTLDAASPTAANAAAGAAAQAIAFATAPIVFPERREAPAAPPPLPPTPFPSPRNEGGVPVAESADASRQPAEDSVAGTPPSFLGEGKGVGAAATEDELSPSFFADDRTDGEGDAIDDEEFGPDDQTPSMFDDVSATPVTASATPPDSAPVSASAPSAGVSEEEEDDTFPAFPTDESDEEDEEEEDDTDIFAPPPPADKGTIARPAQTAPAATDELHAVLRGEEPDPEEHGGIHLEIGQVMRAWPRFLQEAQKISKQTEVMMAKAVPTEAHGKTVTVAFSVRMNYERMNEPKKLEFVRKLLARCLDVDSVAVRFVLDENVPPPPARARSTEKKAVKRDPIAALAELDAIPMPPSPPADDLGGGWSSGFAVSAPPAAPSPPPTPKRVHEEPARPAADGISHAAAGGAPTPVEQNGHGAGKNGNGTTGGDGSVAAARREAALDNPLVQETLQVFGGDIVEE